MLKINHLQVGYGESMILRDVTLRVEPGQVVCLMGRNGIGKSTLMKTIMGLLRPKLGSIEYQDQLITSFPPDRRARMGMGYVPQGRDIFTHLTVEENLLLGLEASTTPVKELPASVFTMFPILREMLKRRGGDLSGGQQQQLALARALVAKPSLLLLDEPMEGIQPSIVMDIEHVIETIKHKREAAVLLVEQSLAFATTIADYYYVLDRGTIVAEGSAAELSDEQVRQHLTV